MRSYNEEGTYENGTFSFAGATMYRRRVNWVFGVQFKQCIVSILCTHGDANEMRIVEVQNHNEYTQLSLASQSTGGRNGQAIAIGY